MDNTILPIQPSASTIQKKTIQDLPAKVLDYMFSFLNFMQRCKIDSVCQRWRDINCSPTQISLQFTIASQSRKLDDGVLNSLLSRRGHSCKKFTLNCNTKLTGESINKIGQHCSNLLHMDLKCATEEQSSCLKTLAPSCPNLKTLRFKNCSECPKSCDDGLAAVAQNCKNLECLHLSNVSCPPPDCFNSMNPNLQSFSMKYGSLTSDGMRSLKTRCHSLKEFKMDWCDISNQRELFDFLKHYNKTLKILRLRSLPFIPNAKWSEEAHELTNLEVLELYRCGHVDDALLEVLANNCVKLQCLEVFSSEVTDTGLLALQKLPSLKELGVSGSVGQGLESLLEKGILRQVTVPRRLVEVCRNLAFKYSNVRFTLDPTEDEGLPEGSFSKK